MKKKKNSTWNIRRLVDESFGPSSIDPATQSIILKIVKFIHITLKKYISLGSNSPLCSLQLVLVINILRASKMTCVCMRSALMLEIGSNASGALLFFGES